MAFQAGEFLAANIKGARLVNLTGCGRVYTTDKTEESNRVVLDFLQRHQLATLS